MTPYNHEYEALVRDMDDSERLAESVFAFREMRDAWRGYELALSRYAIVCTVRADRDPELEEPAEVINLNELIPSQRVGSELAVADSSKQEEASDV